MAYGTIDQSLHCFPSYAYVPEIDYIFASLHGNNVIFQVFSLGHLTLKAPITKVVCFCFLLKCFRRIFGKHCGLRSDCSYREHSDSVVDCLTRDQGVAGSSLTGGTVLCPWVRLINPCLVLVHPRKTCPNRLKNCWLGRKESNRTTLFASTLM